MLLLHSPRLALAVTLLLLAASAVHAVDVFGRGSKLHYEETRQKAPHVERDPRWATVVRLRTLKAFYTEIRREPLCLVYFYTVWSEPSLLIAPELDKQADILWKERPGIAVFAVNLEDAPELAKEYRINTVPNFGVFRHGSLAVPNEQMVPRYPPAISGYMRSLLKDPVVVLKTLSEAEKVVDPKTKAPVMKAKPGLIPVSNPHPDDVFEKSVFLCFTDNEKYGAAIFDASRLLSVFFAIYHTENHKIAKAYGAQMDTCVLYRRWIPEQKPTVYPLEDEAQLSRKILSWLTYNAIPPMAVFDEESKPVYAMRHKPLLIYFSPGRLPSTDPLFTILAQLGSDSTLNITSTQCDPNQSGKHIAHFLGMDGSLRESNYAIGLLIGRRKYRFDSASENPTEANLRRFVKAALGGTWPEFHKSQPESAIREKGHVSDVAFTDFEKWVVQDRKNDALLLFYRPDDRHSVDVIPVFDAVAEHLKGLDIFVARFNVFENDYHTSYAIPGTPTIVYATRTNKTKPVKMGGVARTAENIEAFVAEHASVSLSGLSPSNRTPPSTPQPTPSIKQQQPPRGGEDL